MAQGGIINTALSDRYPVSKQPQRRLFKNMHRILHTYLHARQHDPCTPLHKSVRVCLRCYAELQLESFAHVTRDVSHSIPTAGTGDSPRGQKWAIDSNLTLIQISCATTSTASVIHSSCDTAAMCRGAFYAMGQWNLSR